MAVLAKTPHPLSEDQEPQEALHELEKFAAYVYLAERLTEGATNEQVADQLVVQQFQSDLSTRLYGMGGTKSVRRAIQFWHGSGCHQLVPLSSEIFCENSSVTT